MSVLFYTLLIGIPFISRCIKKRLISTFIVATPYLQRDIADCCFIYILWNDEL